MIETIDLVLSKRKVSMDRYHCFGAMGGLRMKELSAEEMVEQFRLAEHLLLEKDMLSERKKQWISIKKEEINHVKNPTIAVSVEDTEEVEEIWKQVSNASVKDKTVAWKVVLENGLLSKVEIAEEFPLRNETALILDRFRKQFRMTVGAEAMLVEPHTASYKSTVSNISLYGPRFYNKANTEFLRTRFEDFEARGLIKKAGPEVTQASPVLIVRNAKMPTSPPITHLEAVSDVKPLVISCC